VSVMYLIARDYAQGGAQWNAMRLIADSTCPAPRWRPWSQVSEKAGLIVAHAIRELSCRPATRGTVRIASIIEAVRTPASGHLAPAGRAARLPRGG